MIRVLQIFDYTYTEHQIQHHRGSKRLSIKPSDDIHSNGAPVSNVNMYGNSVMQSCSL